jgi:hypothetical protein
MNNPNNRGPFPISVGKTVEVISSIAAHVSAKLESFSSAEPTLTDELCDMFCIWAQPRYQPRDGELSDVLRDYTGLDTTTVALEINKTTQRVEGTNGADFGIRLEVNDVQSSASSQAKVVNPDGSLRRAHQLKELRKQLKKMAESPTGDPFLLIYLPASLLNRMEQGFWTWEQGFRPPSTEVSNRPTSRFGISVIASDRLIVGKRSRWKGMPSGTNPEFKILAVGDSIRLQRNGKLLQVGRDGERIPVVYSLTWLLVEMLLQTIAKVLPPTPASGDGSGGGEPDDGGPSFPSSGGGGTSASGYHEFHPGHGPLTQRDGERLSGVCGGFLAAIIEFDSVRFGSF